MGTIANIVNGLSIGIYQHGSDEWIAGKVWESDQGQRAVTELADYFRKINPDNPHGSFRERMVACGLWKTWTTKAGKVKAVGVMERKSELKALYPDSFRDHAEWRVICAFECLRVQLSTDKALERHEAEAAAKSAAKETEAAGKAGETGKAGKAGKAGGLVQVETSPVKDALGIINRVLAQMEMDDSMADLAGELKKAAAMLAA